MKGKTAIVTGGSSGIGYALAEKFLKEGMNVVISGRDQKKLEEAGKKLSAISPSVLLFQGDVSVEKDCENLINASILRFGNIDVLVNNAGISMRATFAKTQLEVLQKLMNINFWGAVFCTKFALPFLLRSKGSVIGISSIAGKIGLPARTGYSASKFALEGFLETLRTENMETGLHVLTVCPGFTASNIRKSALGHDGSAQGESPRNESEMMSAEETAERIYLAWTKRKRELVLSTEGQLAVIMKKFFPAMLEKMVFKKMKKEKNSPL